MQAVIVGHFGLVVGSDLVDLGTELVTVVLQGAALELELLNLLLHLRQRMCEGVSLGLMCPSQLFYLAIGCR